jgi:hypothetical protein
MSFCSPPHVIQNHSLRNPSSSSRSFSNAVEVKNQGDELDVVIQEQASRSHRYIWAFKAKWKIENPWLMQL